MSLELLLKISHIYMFICDLYSLYCLKISCIHLFQLRLLPRSMIRGASSMCHSLRCVVGVILINVPAPYSEDIRWRVIWFLHFWGYSEEENCFYLGISKWTLWRYMQSYFVSGNVDTQRMGRPFESVQFQPREELIIMVLVNGCLCCRLKMVL